MTGLIELAIALVSGSVALLGDALHNLSDVSTSGRSIAAALAPQIPDMHSFSWMARAAQV